MPNTVKIQPKRIECAEIDFQRILYEITRTEFPFCVAIDIRKVNICNIFHFV